jgi:hypothetical protein
MKQKQDMTYTDTVKMRTETFTTDGTKMKKQRHMRVTLWQEN